jgi:hypothetical protein
MITIHEQRKIVEALAYLERKMSGPDLYEFDMFRKRTKDDEELDSIGEKKLLAMAEKYGAKW